MKIDVFPHIMPEKYAEALSKKMKKSADFSKAAPWMGYDPALGHLDVRLRLMDRYPDVLQVLTVALPPLGTALVTPSDAIELAKLANDEMAELVHKYPDKFIAAVACLPMNDIDAAIEEADRAITQLNLRGVQIFTNIDGEPLGAAKFRPLYERMAYHDLPIWIHPTDQPTPATGPLVRGENPIGGLGWPFETTVAMGSLVGGGVFEAYPNIKFITHHCGGMVPFFHRRIGAPGWAMGLGVADTFRNFYNDTALYGNTSALMCGYDFFGADHLLFGTDMPLGASQKGYGYTLETIRSIERMDIPDADKDKIFSGNAIRLLRLPI
jgi:predicted TIM-barrel fold metal-dependent hydrolase